MNVFFTNECPIVAADEHCYVHQNKMIIEYTQLLSTAHHVLDGERANDIVGIYKKTHANHPSAVWVRKSSEHYIWLWECAMRLCELYTQRTGKTHKTEAVLWNLSLAPFNCPDHGFAFPPVAAPDKFKAMAVFSGVAVAYQRYLVEKFEEWKQREKPIAVEFDDVPLWYHA